MLALFRRLATLLAFAVRADDANAVAVRAQAAVGPIVVVIGGRRLSGWGLPGRGLSRVRFRGGRFIMGILILQGWHDTAFPGSSAPRHLHVFCGYGGAEREDPFLKDYIERGIALIERLEKSDPENLSATIRGFDRETHGSVISHILSSGIRELWGTGRGFVEVMLESGG